MRLTERKTGYPHCDKKGNLTQVDYIEIKDKKLAEDKLCQLEDIEEKYNISSLDDLDNRLSALEIIKEKGVNAGLLSRCANAERYNKGICYELRYLTQEEYDLLKEELC